jgi:DNA ligase (NAD+)
LFYDGTMEERDNPYVKPPVEVDFDDPEEISEAEAREQVTDLREAIEYHDHRYYVENDPVISDKTYDALYARLEALEEGFGFEDENSPTNRVGGEPLDELETRQHVVEMLSLDSSEEEGEVRSFAANVREVCGEVSYHVEPKFDGLSIELVYEDGELEAAVTRGDGVVGEDVTANVRTVRSVPLSLTDAPEELVVRGEILMPKDGFQELNRRRVERGDEPFANPRNAAAGTVRLLDPSVVAERPLEVYVYDVLRTSAELSSQTEAVELIGSLGFLVDDDSEVVDDADGFIEYREGMLERRDELGYEIDGVVAKVDDFDARDALGETSAHPRWAFAYKFPAKTDVTRVTGITVQVGRTGKLTPVVLLEPVDVDGVTISRASLHNQTQARELGVSEGGRVEIERAGDVIPQVKGVVEDGGDGFAMPESCPVCGSDVVREDEHHYCTGGAACPAQLRARLEHFGSRGGMEIEGLGEEVAATLVDEGLVTDLPDLYELDVDEIRALEGYGDRSARKLIGEIDVSKDTDLVSFLTALGVRHVGRERARKLADSFTLDGLREADADELMRVEDIGEEVAESVTGFFGGRGGETVDRLLAHGVEPSREVTGDALEGIKFVLTGSIKGYTRRELTDLLERNGADVTSSVSGETDYLVVGENPGETKLKDARERGVETLDEDEFHETVLARL